jgi:hypothetical protein
MAFTWIITTTSGLLLILRGLHLLFTIIWLSVIFSRFLSAQQNPSNSRVLALASAVLSTLTGAGLFWLTPSDPHTSWGFSIAVGSGLAILMLANQVLSFVSRMDTDALNVTLALPVIFLMSMGSHVGMQISPTSRFAVVIGGSLLPALVIEILGLLPKSRKLLAKPLGPALVSPLLTAAIYMLLEIFSKVG